MNDTASTQPQHHFSVVVSHDTGTNFYIADVPTLGLGTYGFTPLRWLRRRSTCGLRLAGRMVFQSRSKITRLKCVR
jgi:hypothetical protein